MATINKHNLLIVTNLKYFKALKLIGRKSIFDRYKIASNSIIKKYIDEKYRYFLAYPVKEGDTIEFHGIKWQDDEPQVLADLKGNDAIKYQKIKEDTLQHYKNVIESLQNDGKITEADFLGDAIQVVDDRFVFCYDDKVVLCAWGMQMRDNIRKDITEIRKVLIKGRKRKPTTPPVPQQEPIETEEPIVEFEVKEQEEIPNNSFTVRFNSGENGYIEGQTEYSKNDGEFLSENEIPKVVPIEGYEFVGWDEKPNGYLINGDKEFTAIYREIPPVIPPDEKIPWWRRFWLWLTALFAGKGCLKWLLRLLVLLLLIFLLLWLLKDCHRSSQVPVGGGHDGNDDTEQHDPARGDDNDNDDTWQHEPGRGDDGGEALGDNDDDWLRDDPGRGNDGGIYDPYKPYKPKPTPPGYEDVLPPEEGVLPPVKDKPDVLPGNPVVLADRLNILMENEDKSILDLAKDFKQKYPDDKYKVIYYDNVIKRMQILVPKEERTRLKEEIPNAFAPKYELFVFDETLFERRYTPNDPIFSDDDKAWYLKAIHAPKAWDITRGSKNVIVAVVDNGFSLSHPELKSKVVQPYNVWTHSKRIFPQEIDHGTHVAGTALALADNGIGISGIAPNCKFMPIQVANEHNIMTTTSVLDGVIYALYQGADVINISLGNSFRGYDSKPESEQKDIIKNRFKEEERLWREIMRIAARHNATLVVAGGNDNVLVGMDPLQRPELIITVSAVDKDFRTLHKANFSNYGEYSTISAPGVGIVSSVGNDSYQIMDGTSMAAPIVTGAVALMKSLNDTITNKQIICVLKNTGLETKSKIGKMLQLDKALQKVKSGNFDCESPTPSTGDVQVLLSWANYNDLDLIVTDPNGDVIFFKNRSVPSGGQLEIDMNVQYPDSETPVENIFWPEGSAPNGTYNVYLKYYRKHVNITSNPFKVLVKYGDKKEEFTGKIDKVGDVIQICKFTLGNESNTQSPPTENPNNPNDQDRVSRLERQKEQLQQELDRVNNELRKLRNSR